MSAAEERARLIAHGTGQPWPPVDEPPVAQEAEAVGEEPPVAQEAEAVGEDETGRSRRRKSS